MTTRLLMYLGIIILGAIIGAKGKLSEKLTKRLGSIQTACLLLLLTIMGIKIGMDEGVIFSFLSIGYKALIISIFTIGMSILSVIILKPYVKGRKSQ